MPFESAPFGVTGLETAFSALYTYLVEPGVLRLETMLERMSAGPAAIFGLERPRIAVGAPANLTLLDTAGVLAGQGGHVQVTFRELVAAREAAERARAADDRRRSGRAPVSAALVLEDGTVFSGESVGAEGFAFGEAVFTTSMSGYQEVATDPSFEGQIVCFTAPMVGNYGVDEARSESRRSHATRSRDARGARAALDGLAARARHRRADRRRHAFARPASARPRRDARRCGQRRERRRRSADGGARRSRRWQAQHSSPAFRRTSRTPSPPRALCASRSSTTAASARSCAGSRPRGAAVDVFPHDVDADTLAGVRRRPALAGAGRPGTARRRGADGAETCSGARRCSASASVTSCSRSRPVTRRSSCRSGIAARTIPCSTTAATRCSSPRRTTASRSRPATTRPSRTPRSTTARSRGSSYPTERARSAQFHPEATPGPHDAASIISGWVDELRSA